MVNTIFKSISLCKIYQMDKEFQTLHSYWVEPRSFKISPTGLNVNIFFKINLSGNRNNTEVHYGLLENNTFLIKNRTILSFVYLYERDWVFTNIKKICIVYNWCPLVLCSFEDYKMKKILERKYQLFFQIMEVPVDIFVNERNLVYCSSN